jgi:GT2 family glycosyltransferase
MANNPQFIEPISNDASKRSVCAVIVNWNQPALTIECIHSLLRQSHSSIEIILVDNGSTDDSNRLILEQFPELRIVEINENLGYAPAANFGIYSALNAGAGFILLMNNDAVADKNMIAHLLKQYLPDTGILAPVVYFFDRPEKVWSAGGRLRPLLLERTEDVAEFKENESLESDFIEKDFVTGCCMLIPASVFRSVGLLDERFRMYYDDADFCYRVRERGLRILLVPAAKAWHRVAASSSGRNTPNERYWMAKSSVLFFRKHATQPQSLFIIPYRIGSAIRTIFGLLVKGKIGTARAYLIGLWHGLRY